MDKEKISKTIAMWIGTIFVWLFCLAIVLGGIWVIIKIVQNIVGLF